MRTRTLFLSIVILSVCLSASFAAIPGNLWIFGENQGKIQGGSEKQDREGSIDIYGYTHLLITEPDTKTCQPSSTRDHFPVTIIKVVDRSSPLLLRAWRNHELLTVTIRFYAIDPATRMEVNTYTLTLEKAYISGLRQELPLTMLPANESLHLMERVSFTYANMVERWVSEDIAAGDEWHANCQKNSPFSDLNFDGVVNLLDFAIMADEWLQQSF
jgi:type VI secretion system secreted protein Hcp